jgi:HAD superfamily hydrolase (TIGR01490 family)
MLCEVAVFDLDGTLARHGSLVGFARHLAGARGSLAALARGVAGSGVPPRREAFKRAALGDLLRDRSAAEVRARGRIYAERTLSHRMRPGMEARVDGHRDAGHRLVLVTMALDVYVEPLAERLGFEATLSPRVEIVDDRCTGRFLDDDLVGDGKAAALLRLLERRGWEPARLHVYGDSNADAPLYELATELNV